MSLFIELKVAFFSQNDNFVFEYQDSFEREGYFLHHTTFSFENINIVFILYLCSQDNISGKKTEIYEVHLFSYHVGRHKFFIQSVNS